MRLDLLKNEVSRPLALVRTIGDTPLMMLIVLSLGVASFISGDVLPVRGGFGWDGLTYKAIAQNFPVIVLNKSLYAYYIGRVIPSTLVHYALGLLHFPLSDQNLLTAFRVYNIVLLLLSVWVWSLIADQLKLTRSGKWLAFCGLFLSYAAAKKYFYTPVETDQTALFLGIVLLFLRPDESDVGSFANRNCRCLHVAGDAALCVDSVCVSI